MMMTLRVKRGFYDREADRYRPSGEMFEASDARAQAILAAGVAEAVETIDEVTEVAAQESEEARPAKERRSKGKKG